MIRSCRTRGGRAQLDKVLKGYIAFALAQARGLRASARIAVRGDSARGRA
jgi:hypothetical protein